MRLNHFSRLSVLTVIYSTYRFLACMTFPCDWFSDSPEYMRRWTILISLLDILLRRQPNIQPKLRERLVFAGRRVECCPANTRHWTNVVLMLGQRLRRWPSIKTTLVQRLVLANTRHWTNVVLMLGQRLRRWPSIKTTLVQRLVFCELANGSEFLFMTAFRESIPTETITYFIPSLRVPINLRSAFSRVFPPLPFSCHDCSIYRHLGIKVSYLPLYKVADMIF